MKELIYTTALQRSEEREKDVDVMAFAGAAAAAVAAADVAVAADEHLDPGWLAIYPISSVQS